MTATTAGWLACAGLAIGVLALVAALLAVRGVQRRSRRELADIAGTQVQLLADIERRADQASPVAGPPSGLVATEPVIDAVLVDELPALPTAPSAPSGSGTARALDRVASEVLIKTASWSHGLRHVLSGRTRAKIRQEMKLEVKRSRKARKDEVKVAVREYRARERARIAAHNANGENDV